MTPSSHLPDDYTFKNQVARRNRRGKLWQIFYMTSFVVAMLALIALLLNVANEAFGVVAVEYITEPDAISDRPLGDLSGTELGDIMVNYLPNAKTRLRVLIRDNLSQVESSEFTKQPLSVVLNGKTYDPALASLTINEIADREDGLQQLTKILSDNLSTEQMAHLVQTEIVGETVLESWPLFDAIFNRHFIERVVEDDYPGARLEWRSWVNREFISSTQSSVPAETGIRTALLGSFFLLALTVGISFPVGVGAAIYLQEYATDTWYNRLIETNIRNLAGVPSIIYGMLGLAIFVRVLEPITSGRTFGFNEPNGRTLISAAFTLALLILPVIITASQEALRAVPQTIREASYGLGGTKWQTISRQVLPVAMPGILTGTIIAMSRAVGETAPLIVVGASTFILTDPNTLFSKFTVLPIQIYGWTSRPDPQFRDAAAAAILVLLFLLITMNTVAIYLRNRYSRRF